MPINMRTGILGGSFNPPHKGHISLANQVIDKLLLDKIILIPANQPPHKSDDSYVPFWDRYKMCEIAAKSNPKISVSAAEHEMGGVSYTINTIKKLKENKEDEWYLIIGSDMFLMFDKWRDYKKILEEVTVVAASRARGGSEKMREYLNNLKAPKGKIIILDVQITEVSSTEIREEISRGIDPPTVQSEVLRYIKQKNFYTKR